MHKRAWFMAVSLSYRTPLNLSLKFCNRFNRQKQENDKIKFWKSVPSYVLVRKYQWRKKIVFIPGKKWENLKNVLFYRQQITNTIKLWQNIWEIHEAKKVNSDDLIFTYCVKTGHMTGSCRLFDSVSLLHNLRHPCTKIALDIWSLLKYLKLKTVALEFCQV